MEHKTWQWVENVKNLICKQNRNMKHVYNFIIATGFLYTNYKQKIKSISVRTKLDSIHDIHLQASTYISSFSGPIFVPVILRDLGTSWRSIYNIHLLSSGMLKPCLALSRSWQKSCQVPNENYMRLQYRQKYRHLCNIE